MSACGSSRIKSEGDYEAGKIGRNVWSESGSCSSPEVLARYEALDIARIRVCESVYKLVTDENGKVTDVTVSYDEIS